MRTAPLALALALLLAATAHADAPPRGSKWTQAFISETDDSGRNATLISRGAYLLSDNELVSLDLYGDDWRIPAGHRVGVLVTGANAEWWSHVPTGGTVTVRDARITLPYLECTRGATLPGDISLKLEDYRVSAPVNVPAATVAAAERADFAVPPTSTC